MSGSRETIKEYTVLSVPILVGGYLFLNPFPHVTALQEICFYLSIALTLVLAGTRSLRFSFESPLTATLVLYVLWSFASVFWARDRMNAFHDFYTHLITYIILYYLLVNVFTGRRRAAILVSVIAVSTATFSLGAIVYFYQVMGNPLQARLYPDPQVQPNMIGILVTFGAILSLLASFTAKRVPARVICIICFLANLSATALTYSRGALAALSLSLLLFFSTSVRRLLLVLLAGALILVLMVTVSPGFKHRLSPESISRDGRVTIILTAWEIIKEHPLRGIGFDMEAFKEQWREYNTRLPKKFQIRPYSHTHNFILDITVRTGLIGLALFLALLIICVARLWRLARSGTDLFVRRTALGTLSALAGLLVAGMTGNIMNNHKSAILLYVVFALMTILWKLNESLTAGGEGTEGPSQAGE
ncbi:MAG: O-antigen ligase family protein [Deltaproteobacteria bacterium]|nr:O-antigen ligase family protein [Deltaproteobacteria bacterium]